MAIPTRYFNKSTNQLINNFSFLTIAAIILSISTGVGTILAYVFSSQIRVYARISPFIAFMAITSFLLIVQNFNQRIKQSAHRIMFQILIFGFTLLSFIDQIIWYSPATTQVKNEYISDQHLVQLIEVQLIDQSAIFQLPYKPFPESPSINELSDYDQLKPYLHSKNLKWSSAGIKGRPGDKWYQTTANLPSEQMIRELQRQGFSGILLHRDGYQDSSELENQFYQQTLTEPIISQDQRLVFFKL